ncbi:MAG: DUF3990 domain-containing protein [Alistipes sp.]|nr:DUF3990 domain-containing protein [Candidatus Alistipes equi]
MILYHGSNIDFDTINIKIDNHFKDFGEGFYLTPDVNTAKRMALKKARLFGGNASLIEYEFNEDALKDENLNVKIFPERATEEWAEFVYSNRDKNKDISLCHGYDIIVGPIANDGVAYLLDRYQEGTILLKELTTELQDKYLDQQYYFGSDLSVMFLKKSNRRNYEQLV